LDASVLTEDERRFLRELDARGVRYMIVGLTAAGLQGANTATVDIDLWFESIGDPGINAAATAAGGLFVGGFGLMPARLGGSLERFDIVVSMSGIGTFREEFDNSKPITVEGVPTRVLSLERILASKRAANRLKDQAVIPALEEALAAIDGDDPKG